MKTLAAGVFFADDHLLLVLFRRGFAALLD
jgi:hypothetical protein